MKWVQPKYDKDRLFYSNNGILVGDIYKFTAGWRAYCRFANIDGHLHQTFITVEEAKEYIEEQWQLCVLRTL